MEAPQVVRELKRDAFGRVELLEGPRGRLVRRVACGGRAPGSHALARVFLAHERRALRALEGIEGVARVIDSDAYAAAPSLDGATPRARDVLLRSWLEGVPLYAAMELPEDFFERLEDLVRDLHTRGVCHNDLHKEPNVLVAPDGRPALLDFQLSSLHPGFGRRYRVRVAEDLRHVAKHRRRYALGTGRDRDAVGLRLPKRRSLLAAAWMRCGKPVYNVVTRRVFALEDGEPRRPSVGPWPTWTPPVGALVSRGEAPPDRGRS